MLKQSFSLIVCLSLVSVNILANNEDENKEQSSRSPVSITTVISITGMAGAYIVFKNTNEGAALIGLSAFLLSGMLGIVHYHHDCEDKYLDKYARLQKEQHVQHIKDQYNSKVALQERMLARREEIKKNRASTKLQVPQE